MFTGFERARTLDPKNSNALNWQGIAYAYVGDNESAAALHRRCVEIDPTLAACRSNLAIELVSLGRKDEASAVVDAAIDAGAFAEGPAQMILLAELERRDAFLLVALICGRAELTSTGASTVSRRHAGPEALTISSAIDDQVLR